MKINWGETLDMQALTGRLRWYACSLYQRLGPLPLLIFVGWLGALIFLGTVLSPENTHLEHSIEDIRLELGVPLPMLAPEQAALQNNMSITEYQQVKAIFDILSKHQLMAQESRYKFIEASDSSPEQLGLDIPMKGDYRHFYDALSELTATLPVKVNTITLSRSHPDLSDLQIMLRVTVAGVHQ